MILHHMKQLHYLSQQLNQPLATELIAAVEKSMERSSFHIAILGEFKRGKTTFVNSLIGRDLLYSDILPATAFIHIVEYATEERVEVWYTDGHIECLPLSQEHLAALSAGANLDPASIRYVKILLDHDLLRDGIVLIDTPGVNDLVASRAEITAQILPHCDAALFLLDSAAPLTRSEAEFLKAKVYYHKLNQLLFILSKSDRLDEEELEEALDGAMHRVKQVTGSALPVFPYSSKLVMQQALTAQSGRPPELQYIINQIYELREQAQSEHDKRNQSRLMLAAGLCLEQVELQQSIHHANQEQLQQLSAELAMYQEEVSVRFHRLLSSIELIGRNTLLDMLAKSYAKFKQGIVEQLRYDIQTRQAGLDRMVDREIPLYIEQQLRRFIEAKSTEIQIFTEKLEKHIADEYQKHFRLPLAKLIESTGIALPSWRADLTGDGRNQVETVIKQAAPFTIGAVVGTLVLPGIGSIIGGAVGMAVNTYAKNKQQEHLREHLLASLDQMIEEVVHVNEEETRQVVNHWFDQLLTNLTAYHDDQRGTLEGMIRDTQQPGNLQQVELELSDLLVIRDQLVTILQEQPNDKEEATYV